MSIAFVGLILFSLFLKKRFSAAPKLLRLPICLFIALAISIFYSSDFINGSKVLWSRIEFIAVPFIFFINREKIQAQIGAYLNVFLSATTLAAFLTFLFFLLPPKIVQTIAENLPFLKDYVMHEKSLAFGVYSPFTERLQFSYLIVIAIFLLFWKILKVFTNALPEPFEGKEIGYSKPIIFGKTKRDFFIKITFQILILIIVLAILGARGAQIGFLVGTIPWIIGAYFHYIHVRFVKRFNAVFSYSLVFFTLLFFLVITPLVAYKNIPAVQARYNQMQWELGTFQDGTYKEYDYVHFTSIRRLLSWKNSWTIIQENTILGVGIGDYQAAMEKQYARDNLGFPVNTQSQYLYYWAASGLLGLFIFLLLIGYPFYQSLIQKDKSLKLLGISFFLFYGLIFLFDAPLNFQVGAMTFLVMYGLFTLLIYR